MKATIIIIVAAALAKIFSTDLEEVVYTPNYASKSFVAKQFAQKNKMDSTICFLIDMKAHSGKKRFAIWDLNGDSARREMIVCHGSAGAKGLPISSADSPVFFFLFSGYASSLGKYRVGKRSYSN